jgi:RsmE family RNA methyltransferase
VNLILLDPSELDATGLARVSDARAAHMRGVLNVAVGHEVRVGVIDGGRGIGTIAAIDGESIVMQCAIEAVSPPRPPVDLLLAVPRPKVMRRLWAQISAMGVGRIILTNAERVERDYFDAHTLNEAEYRPLLIEGLQQARDTRVPEVSIHKRFKVLVEDDLDALCPNTVRLVAHPGTDTNADSMEGRVFRSGRNPGPEGPGLHGVLAVGENSRVLLAIGPEGGWNDFELTLLGAHGFQAIGMGPRSLRSDTACIALLALVHAAMRNVAQAVTPNP